MSLTTSQLRFASGLGDSLGEVRHHQLQGRVIISRAPVSYRADGVSGHGWLLVPVGFARRDGGHLYFDQEVWPDQAGITPSMKAGLWVMNLLRTST